MVGAGEASASARVAMRGAGAEVVSAVIEASVVLVVAGEGARVVLVMVEEEFARSRSSIAALESMWSI